VPSVEPSPFVERPPLRLGPVSLNDLPNFFFLRRLAFGDRAAEFPWCGQLSSVRSDSPFRRRLRDGSSGIFVALVLPFVLPLFGSFPPCPLFFARLLLGPHQFSRDRDSVHCMNSIRIAILSQSRQAYTCLAPLFQTSFSPVRAPIYLPTFDARQIFRALRVYFSTSTFFCESLC